MPRVVWAEEFRNSLKFEIGPRYDDLPTRCQGAADGQSSCSLMTLPSYERLKMRGQNDEKGSVM